MSLAKDIKYRYARLTIAEKLIAINVFVFIIVLLITYLFKSGLLLSLFSLPKELTDFIVQPWTILTYAFLHGSFTHLFINMIVLYFAARLFLSLYATKRFLNVYFLGAIVGGLFFILSYNLFPAFIGTDSPYLVGASASISAIIIFITTAKANMETTILNYKIQLWKIGVFFVALDLIQIPFNNPGGHIAHLGGAFLGYVYAKQLAQGKDIGKGFESIMDYVASFFNPKQKTTLKTVHKKTTKNKTNPSSLHPLEKQQRINAILDKINKSGYESLTQAEKNFLFRAGNDA